MACECGSSRILDVNAKCGDMCRIRLGHMERDGYVPRDIGIGGGDYIRFELCLDCGRVQAEFPVSPSNLPFEEGEPLDGTHDEG